MQTFSEGMTPRRGTKASICVGFNHTLDDAAPAGVVVTQAAANHVKLPTSAAEVLGAVGVLVYDPLTPAPSDDDTTNDYSADTTVEVVDVGEMWVVCEEAMAVTESIYCRHTANGAGKLQLGAIRDDADGDTCTLLPAARVVYPSSGAGVCKIRLNLPANPSFADTDTDTSADTVVTAQVASPSAAVIATLLCDKAGTLESFGIRVGTCGSAGTTTVIVNKNGTPVTDATISVAHDDPDGTATFLDTDDFGAVSFAQGDLLTIEVTAAATDVANLSATARVAHAA
ncbi:MAG: hypothetical protein WC683_06285 [bacterium]